jgi:hypothetical protein
MFQFHRLSLYAQKRIRQPLKTKNLITTNVRGTTVNGSKRSSRGAVYGIHRVFTQNVPE